MNLAIEAAIGLGLAYAGGRALGVIGTPSTPAAAAAGAAPVPAGQSAGYTGGAAPAIPGHVIPTPPEPSAGDPYAFLRNVPLPAGYSTDFLPRVQQGSGLWTDGTGRPYQFPDPNTGAPMGVAGYMPIEYAAHLAAMHTAADDVGNDGSSSSSSDSGGGLPPWAGSALAAGGTAVLGAVASGTGAAAAVGAAAAAGLAALGPVPGVASRKVGTRAGWASTTIETLVIEAGARTLGVNVSRSGAKWSVVAIETSTDAAQAHGAPGLSAMYADHAHLVVGVYDYNHQARAAAVAYGERWFADHTEPVRCPCPELAVSP